MNFGKVQLPTKWEDITLEQFQELMRIYNEEDKDILDIVSLFSKKDKKELRQMPAEFVETMIVHLQFMNCKLDAEPISNILIDGNLYKLNYMEKLKMGEWVDSETVMQADKYDYSSLLGILCRLDGEVYDDDFIANKLDKRIEMFKQLSITKALGLLNFFLLLKMRYLAHSQKSLAVKKGKELAELLVQHIKSSVMDGDGKKLDSIYAKIALKRWEQSLKCI